MGRSKKDHEIRKSVFIEKARKLFFSKGYESTSVQDILEAVGENSASPSVFYHYFSSKEEIYHDAIEIYIAEYINQLEGILDNESLQIEERLIGMMNIYIATLLESNPGIDICETMGNRLFALDLRERITRRVASMWERVVSDLPWLQNVTVGSRSLSLYLTGGICELVYDFVFINSDEQRDTRQLFLEIFDYSATVLHTPEPIYQQFIEKFWNAPNGKGILCLK